LFAEIAELKAMLAQKNKVETYRQGDNIGLEVAKRITQKSSRRIPVNKKNDLHGKTKRIEETIFVLVRFSSLL
jgi:hypothetical protein